MRTLVFLLAGLVLGGVIVGGGRAAGRARGSALTVFGALWVAVAGWNLYEGVANAGYTVLEELPIFLVIVLVPLVVVALVSRRLG